MFRSYHSSLFNVGTVEVQLDSETVECLDGLVNHDAVVGPRYSEVTQQEIDTDEF